MDKGHMPLWSWARDRIGHRASPFVPLAAGLLLLCIYFPSGASAEGISAFADYNYLSASTETTIKETGQVHKSDFSELIQLYNLNLSKMLYPYLTFKGGGVFEWDSTDVSSDGSKSSVDERIIRPFFELDLDNPLYSAGLGYRKTEIRTDITGQTSKELRDEYMALLNWKPVDLPQLYLNYIRSYGHDVPRTIDTVGDQLTVQTRYSYANISGYYSYLLNKDKEKIADFTTTKQLHNGKLNYFKSFFDNRLTMNTGYLINYSVIDFKGRGTGLFPAFPNEGLSAISTTTPSDGPVLVSNGSLINGDKSSSAGLNIGTNGDSAKFVNMGLDFGFRTQVDTIYVYVDKRLTPTVSDSFRWDVYVSADDTNTEATTWNLVASVQPVPFEVLDNLRFEISFPSVEARFIKVVTKPLSPLVQGALAFPDVFVTEMEAFTTVSGTPSRTFTDVNHNYNLGLSWRVTDKTTAGYTLFYRLEETDPDSLRKYSISNGVDLGHIFSRRFMGRARLLRTDLDDQGEKTVNYSYSASLRAAWLETFSQTLTYSGTNVTEEQGSSSTNSVFLHNTADLYRGWSAYLDFGYAWNKLLEEGRSKSIFGRVGTNVVPNERVNLTLNYSANQTEQTGKPSELLQSGSLQMFILPLKTLTLFTEINVVSDREGTRVFQNYAVNWSPFPEGALQLFVAYNEILEPEGKETKSLSPGLRWDISRHATLSMSYGLVKSETKIQKADSKQINANLRIAL